LTPYKNRVYIKRMSRAKRAVAALSVNYIKLTVNTAIKLFITPFYLKYLGAELMGFRYFVVGILDYFQIVDFGTKGAISAIVAKKNQNENSDTEELLKFLRAGGQMQICYGIIIFLLTLALCFFIPTIASGLSDENKRMGQWCTLGFGMGLSIIISSGVYSGILTGKQLLAQNSIYNMIADLFKALIGVLLVYIGFSLYGIAIATFLASFYVFFQLRWRTSKLGIKLKLWKPPIEFSSMTMLWKLSGWILLAFVGGLLGMHSARVILGVFPGFGMAEVTKFSLLVTVPFIIRSQANRISVILRPGLTQLYHSNADKDKIQQISILLLRLSSLVAATAFVGIWLINGHFLILWVGPEYYTGDISNLLVASSVGIAIWIFSFSVLVQVRFEFKRQGIISFCTGIITLLFSLLFTHEYGVLGVLLGGIIGQLSVQIPFIVLHVLRHLSEKEAISKIIFKTTWIPFTLICFWIFLNNKIEYKPTTWTETIISSLVIGFVSIIAGGMWLKNDLKKYSILKAYSNR
jgi:O-antigen/teichoic acid export membrane protein